MDDSKPRVFRDTLTLADSKRRILIDKALQELDEYLELDADSELVPSVDSLLQEYENKWQ